MKLPAAREAEAATVGSMMLSRGAIEIGLEQFGQDIALIVIGAKERLDAVRLAALGDRHVVAIAEALLRLEHERESHAVPPRLLTQPR